MNAILQESHLDISCDAPENPNKKKELAKTYTQFIVSGNTYRPVGPVTLEGKLTSGSYKIQEDLNGIFFERVQPATDSAMVFENSPMDKVVHEIKMFWERKDAFKDLGLMHTRGVLVHGRPGMGKSILLQQVAQHMESLGDVTLFADSPSTISRGLKAVRCIEPDRRIVVMCEEVDEMASYNERTLLQLMDGDLKSDNVLYLGTTNYIERLSPRLLRPGRFDKRINIPPPTFEHRVTYLKAKLVGKADDKQITEMAKKTEGFGFGHMRELIAGVYAIGDNLDEVIARLKDSRNMVESKAKQIQTKKSLQESRTDTVSSILG